ncbi:MAG: formylglycine-generating enzyme family protein [Magnetococcales bacterium]|nr:formylglycine-generating enzyme family protein [Magnetococcales bacterium]
MNLPLRTDSAWHPLVDGFPPSWASGWGQDRFGVFVEFTLQGIQQRLRWIPPGRFLMGSPEDEPGRFDAEGPQRKVTIGQGFWLFDTPCTQALWQVVMKQNSSRFQTRNRPVEQVSFEDVQAFLSCINQACPGLDLTLPSEAQWEYACRAGTMTALYSGAITILGVRNAPALDPIAWYGGNSGVDPSELPNGADSSIWVEKQDPHDRAGTHPVAMKNPNLWGLYDMLGNVFEWCADAWHDSYEGAPVDGRVWENDGPTAVRVFRGGSWSTQARLVRAAFRGEGGLAYRGDNLGFRCARVQS